MTLPPKRDWETYAHPAMTYKRPRGLRRFQAGLALVVSVLLVVGLCTLVWFVSASWVKSSLTDWIAARHAQGMTIGYETMETAGFPSRIVLTLTKPFYTGPLLGRGVDWHGESLTVVTRPWWPWRLHVEVSGKHTLALDNGAKTWLGRAQVLSADLVPGDLWPQTLDLNIAGLEMSDGEAAGVDDLQMHFKYEPDGMGLIVAVKGTNLVLPRNKNLFLGNKVKNLDVAIRVIGALTPGGVIKGLPRWRDRGGRLEVERFKIRSGPLGVAGAGTATLDGDLQPMGAFTAKIEGLFQVLEILRVRGVVRGSDAVIATMALSALSKRSKISGVSSINLAVTVQDGKLSLGSIPVMTMPRMDWGLAAPLASVPETPPVRDYKDVPAIF